MVGWPTYWGPTSGLHFSLDAKGGNPSQLRIVASGDIGVANLVATGYVNAGPGDTYYFIAEDALTQAQFYMENVSNPSEWAYATADVVFDNLV